MTKTALIIKELPGNRVLAAVERVSACSGDCSACKGCGTPPVRIEVELENTVGASAGDIVTLESSTGKILRLSALVYLMPLVMFFALYAISPVWGGAGFLAAIAALIPINRLFSKKHMFTIVGLTRSAE